jgi:hypothetical protein
MKRNVDPKRLHDMEARAREVARLLDTAIHKGSTVKTGFMLLLFDFDGPEATYISNAVRDDMVKALRELLDHFAAGTADSLSRPKGRG